MAAGCGLAGKKRSCGVTKRSCGGTRERQSDSMAALDMEAGLTWLPSKAEPLTAASWSGPSKGELKSWLASVGVAVLGSCVAW